MLGYPPRADTPVHAGIQLILGVVRRYPPRVSELCMTVNYTIILRQNVDTLSIIQDNLLVNAVTFIHGDSYETPIVYLHGSMDGNQ